MQTIAVAISIQAALPNLAQATNGFYPCSHPGHARHGTGTEFTYGLQQFPNRWQQQWPHRYLHIGAAEQCAIQPAWHQLQGQRQRSRGHNWLPFKWLQWL